MNRSKEKDILVGQKDMFAIRFAFRRDPHSGQGATPEETLSWGAFEIWVDGVNPCEHLEMSETISPVLLEPLVTGGEAVPIRVALGWLTTGFPGIPPGDRNSILVAGLQTALTVLPTPQDRFQWLQKHIFPLAKGVGNHWARVGVGWRWRGRGNCSRSTKRMTWCTSAVARTARKKSPSLSGCGPERPRERGRTRSCCRERRRSGTTMSSRCPEWTPGQRVSHAEMGEGVVLAQEPSGYAGVFFQQYGERRVPVTALTHALP